MAKLTPEQMERIKGMSAEDWKELQDARGVPPDQQKSFADLLQFATSLDARLAALEGKPKPAGFFAWLFGPIGS